MACTAAVALIDKEDQPLIYSTARLFRPMHQIFNLMYINMFMIVCYRYVLYTIHYRTIL